MSGIKSKLTYTADEFKALEVPETNFYLEPFIPTEGIVLLFGKPGTFKTTILFNIANAIANGLPLWGIKTTKAAPVLIMEMDSPLQVIQTRFGGCFEDDSPVHVFPYHGVIDFLNHSDRAEGARVNGLADLHAELGFKVVLIDTLSRIHGLDDLKAQSVSPVYSAFQRLFPGATLVFVHHGKKTTPDQTAQMRMESFSGSQQWAAQAQVVIMVDHHDIDKNQVTIEVVKSQVAERTPALVLQAFGSAIRLESEAKIDQVGAFMATAPPGLSKKKLDAMLAKVIGQSEYTARNRRQAWERLQPDHGQTLPFVRPVCSPEATEQKRVNEE